MKLAFVLNLPENAFRTSSLRRTRDIARLRFQLHRRVVGLKTRMLKTICMGVSVLSVVRQQCLDGDEIKSIGLAGTDRIGSPSQ